MRKSVFVKGYTKRVEKILDRKFHIGDKVRTQFGNGEITMITRAKYTYDTEFGVSFKKGQEEIHVIMPGMGGMVIRQLKRKNILSKML